MLSHCHQLNQRAAQLFGRNQPIEYPQSGQTPIAFNHNKTPRRIWIGRNKKRLTSEEALVANRAYQLFQILLFNHSFDSPRIAIGCAKGIVEARVFRIKI